MQLSALFSIVALTGVATAWSGQLAADAEQINEGGCIQKVYLTDHNTKSTYTGYLQGCFTATRRYVQFDETTPGGYDFGAFLWKTNDGCHNIDFQGSLDAGHGYCCGSLPCSLTA
ncbi:hypothetical protein GGI35DRAFT_439781 [Trichoderma velutinum]